MSRCTLINSSSKPGLYVFRVMWEGESLVTWVGEETQEKAEKEAEKRLTVLKKTGGGLWYRDVTDEEIRKLAEAFNRDFGKEN